MEKTYKSSDTQLVAQWIKPYAWKPFQCSNCEEGLDYNPLYSHKLHKFCPNCGARMLNSNYIHIHYDYEDID